MKRKPPGEPYTAEFFLERSSPEPNSGCWIWMNAISDRNGYGAIRRDGRTVRAHRLSYEVHHNVSVLRAVDVCHTCDIRCCVNPEHLFLGTRTDNMRDCANKGRIRIPGLVGEDCPAAKLTEADVLAIRSSVGVSQRKLARHYGVNKGAIAQILRRKTWRHV